jgi:hypothetical protein
MLRSSQNAVHDPVRSSSREGEEPFQIMLEPSTQRLKCDIFAKSQTSAKTPITNRPTSTPFQTLTNGIRLASVIAPSGRNLRFGEERRNGFQN